ncbi:MAG: hypothetical protein M1812_004200 [Candelaria pacifica]|nr:MAG: hypothetical protein M1812_004200 [Candelaria pacifica]
MSRLALSTADKRVRDWFIQTTSSLHCSTKIDAMGNIFAIRPGRRDGPPTVAGSHLDTQPTGGRYDGILGVMAGIEMLRVMDENWIETEFPVGVVNWTNEEGARFPASMVASGVWAGEFSLERAYALEEVGGGGRTMRGELERIGYKGEMEASWETMKLAAHFELHIEQGPILEAASKKIGIVEGVQAYRWYTITVRGREAHSGTTDFSNRSDAMLAAARMIMRSHSVAALSKCLATTGVMTVKPGSTNTIPGYVQFSLDLRGSSESIVQHVEQMLKREFEVIARDNEVDVKGTVPERKINESVRGRGCSVDWREDTRSSAITFHQDCVRCVKESACGLLGDGWEGLTQKMTSGAGHDSVYTSKRCPTSMIFVPCRDGVSHNPAEYCAPEDCANGAQVLLGAVLRYDRLRASKETSLS